MEVFSHHHPPNWPIIWKKPPRKAAIPLTHYQEQQALTTAGTTTTMVVAAAAYLQRLRNRRPLIAVNFSLPACLSACLHSTKLIGYGRLDRRLYHRGRYSVSTITNHRLNDKSLFKPRSSLHYMAARVHELQLYEHASAKNSSTPPPPGPDRTKGSKRQWEKQANAERVPVVFCIQVRLASMSATLL